MRKSCGSEKKKKGIIKKSILIAIIVAVIALIVIVISSFILPLSQIDPFEHTIISFEGYNTTGKAKVTVDKTTMVELLIGSEPSSLEESIQWQEKYAQYYNDIDCFVEPSENLSNGDVVIVAFSASGLCEGKIKDGSRQYTVSGLTEVEMVDVFSSFEMIFEGASGKATGKGKINSEIAYLKACQFDFSKESNLKNGEIVTVSITNVDSLLKQYQIMPKETSKEYTVSGLGEYITSADQIPKSLIDELASRFVTEIDAENADDFMWSYDDAEYFGAYLLVNKSEDSLKSQNELHIVVCYKEYMRGEFRDTIYKPLVFKNIIINPDGKLDITYADGSNTTFRTDMTDYIEDQENNYQVLKID